MIISPQTFIVGGKLVSSGIIPPIAIADSLGEGKGTTITPVPPKPQDINLLSETLDPRVTYSGPVHLYWGQNGLLVSSEENQWPLEYRNGQPVGRSFPEPESLNYQENCRAVATSSNVIVSSGSTLQIDETGAPDGGGICLVPVAGEFYLVSEDVGGVTLVTGQPYSLSDDWTRLVFPCSPANQSRCRIWLGRDIEISDGSPFVFLTQTDPLDPGDYVFSWFARNGDDTAFHAGIGVIEKGNYPYATSPIITEDDNQITRLASSVTITIDGDTTNIGLIYDDGSIEFVQTSGQTSVSLPYPSWNWGERYLTRITFQNEDIDLSDIDLTTDTQDPRVRYIGPSHSYIDENGTIATSEINEWPLEYVDGQPVGRHEPEPEATNYALDSALTNLGAPGVNSNWMYSEGSVITTTAVNNSDFPFINSEVQKVNVGIFNESDNGFIVQDLDPGTSENWSRVVVPFTNDTTSQLRFYTQREKPSSYLYEKCPDVPTGECVASVYRRLTADAMQAQAPQLELGSFPTSPIFNAQNQQSSRAESEVIVTNPGVANHIVIHYSDGETLSVPFENNQVVVPLSGEAWSSRYMTRITFTYL